MKDLTDELYNPVIIALNRYMEMSLVFFNVLVALMLLTAPWYIVENSTTFNAVNDGCAIPEGTALAPFVSKPCGKAFTVLLNGGKEWRDMHVYVWVYFVLAIICSAIIGYEVVKHGVREWSDANTIGFVVQLILLIIQSIILITSADLVKPENVNASTAEILIITAVVISSVRIVMLGFFMYITKKHAPRGFFGTGSYI
jgi:hypothetical protein